jgi:aspartyl-tRNA(Asn)/glutamyl-tRNA(Gln) amidotransferase subunit A
MQHIAGWDPLDENSTRKKVPAYERIVENSIIKGLRIGIPRKYFFDHISSEVESLFYNCIDVLASAGSLVLHNDLGLRNTEQYKRAWQNIRLAEASAIHIKWLKTRAEDYSQEVRQMLVQGAKVPAVDYISAANIMRKIRKEFLSILDSKVDVIMVPTTIVSAPKFDEEEITTDNASILQTREALLQNTILFNGIGLPAISIPIGLIKDKMPVAAQIIGPPFMDQTVMSMAYYYECRNDSLKRFIPPILS